MSTTKTIDITGDWTFTYRNSHYLKEWEGEVTIIQPNEEDLDQLLDFVNTVFNQMITILGLGNIILTEWDSSLDISCFSITLRFVGTGKPKVFGGCNGHGTKTIMYFNKPTSKGFQTPDGVWR